jgi:hypothetical protein
LSEYDEVIIWFGAGSRSGAHSPITRCDVRLHTDDRLDPGLLRPFLERPGGVEVTVVGDCQRRLLELERALYEIVDPVRSVEQRIPAS